MAAALPPGAWWETANRGGVAGPPEPYGPYAGDAAVAAARRGNLELRGLQFAYPLRPNVPGKPACRSLEPHVNTRAYIASVRQAHYKQQDLLASTC